MSGLRQEIGYLEGTAYPGGPGNAVLAGHVTLKGGINGPFIRLREMNPGDIVVAQDDATDYVYRVEWIKEVDEADIEVTAPTDIPSMTLITCTQWSVDLHAYTKRLIVRAELIEQH
jgi:LPXTG-site transpeptidase (sortase) family protein